MMIVFQKSKINHLIQKKKVNKAIPMRIRVANQNAQASIKVKLIYFNNL